MPEILISWIPLQLGKWLCLMFDIAKVLVFYCYYWKKGLLLAFSKQFNFFFIYSEFLSDRFFNFFLFALIDWGAGKITFFMNKYFLMPPCRDVGTHPCEQHLCSTKESALRTKYLWNYSLMWPFFLWQGHKALHMGHHPLHREVIIYVL